MFKTHHFSFLESFDFGLRFYDSKYKYFSTSKSLVQIEITVTDLCQL